MDRLEQITMLMELFTLKQREFEELKIQMRATRRQIRLLATIDHSQEQVEQVDEELVFQRAQLERITVQQAAILARLEEIIQD